MKGFFDFSADTLTMLDVATDEVLGKVLGALGENAGGRTGGMIRIRYAMNCFDGLRGWHQVYARRVGTREGDNWESVEVFSEEKSHRLMKLHQRDTRQVSSFQTRNPDNNEWGGAFIAEVLIPDLGWVKLLVSFSGLPEEADEVFGLRLLQEMESAMWRVKPDSREAVLEQSKSYQKFGLAEKLLSAA